MAIEAGNSFHEIAEAIAPSWEARRAEIEEVCAPVQAWLLRELAPREGDTVLELAAGIGDTGFEAAALVGPRGRLISTDLSPAMLAGARRRGAELGLANVEYRVMDAERIELDADSVDGVVCRFGYMLLGDVAAALSETRRVLRPDGRLALAVWGALERNPHVAVVGMIMGRRGHIPPPEPPPAPGVFSMASPQRTSALLRHAGFGAVRVEEVPVRLAAPDVDGYLAWIADTAGPLALVLRALPEAEREAVRAEVAEALAPFATDDGYELPGEVVCAAAR